jgi:hypothetical protein
MNTLSDAMIFADKVKTIGFAAWFVTAILVLSGFQLLKDLFAFILMKLYEFFIQRNALEL